MGFFRYILFILFLALFIKLLISYVEKLSISLNDKIIKSQIELGLLSIKDFQKDNYETFIKIIKIYLDILGFKNISPLNSDDNNLTDFKCISNTDSILVSCTQNSLYGKEAKRLATVKEGFTVTRLLNRSLAGEKIEFGERRMMQYGFCQSLSRCHCMTSRR